VKAVRRRRSDTLGEEDDLAVAPSSLSFAEAAAVPIAGATALLGLRDQALVQPDEQVLIVGAAESTELVRSLGADHVIDYTDESFTDRGERYDVIFQIAGSASGWACRRALKPGGRLVLCRGDGHGPGKIVLAT